MHYEITIQTDKLSFINWHDDENYIEDAGTGNKKVENVAGTVHVGISPTHVSQFELLVQVQHLLLDLRPQGVRDVHPGAG